MHARPLLRVCWSPKFSLIMCNVYNLAQAANQPNKTAHMRLPLDGIDAACDEKDLKKLDSIKVVAWWLFEIFLLSCAWAQKGT